MMNLQNNPKLCTKQKIPTMHHPRNGVCGVIKAIGTQKTKKVMKKRMQPMKFYIMKMIKKMLR
eukprot:69743-Prorocentrum_lima.AAC.1